VNSNEWHLFSKKKPPKNTELWVAFHYERKRWPSDNQHDLKLCQYTPNYIVSLCEEDEGSWRGLGSEDCDAAFAWRIAHTVPAYPIELEEKYG